MKAELVDQQGPHIGTVKRRKLAWFGHVTRYDSLCKTPQNPRGGVRVGGSEEKKSMLSTPNLNNDPE
ncbi:hypothetical protein DPMN_163730 [Dreissena polymorpha]|uniref:Uncharacterized protein n=1 Tax=Dreissena polymorpha TaxID=45954 RepID=A0A9D4ESR4_DREPO|nr:hypothetical protein DPMN_163730 [Dreissena polymorpha]